MAADPSVFVAQRGHRLHGGGNEDLCAVSQLDQAEERVFRGVGIVRVLFRPLDGFCHRGNLPSAFVRPLVAVRLFPYRCYSRVVERFPMDFALLANAQGREVKAAAQ